MHRLLMLFNTLTGNDKIWIGGQRTQYNTFNWVHNRESFGIFEQSNWHQDEPSDILGGNEDCVMLKQKWKWNDAACQNKHAFLCEF